MALTPTMRALIEALASDTPLLASVAQVATLLSVDERTVYRLAKRGDLTTYKIAGTLRVSVASVGEYLCRQQRHVPAAIKPGPVSTYKPGQRTPLAAEPTSVRTVEELNAKYRPRRPRNAD